MSPATQSQLDAAAASRLRRLNVIVGSAHAVQAVVLLAIATAVSLPITASFLVGPPGAGDYGSASIGSVRIDWLVAAFLLLAAVDHLPERRTAAPLVRDERRAGSTRPAGGSTRSARRS